MLPATSATDRKRRSELLLKHSARRAARVGGTAARSPTVGSMSTGALEFKVSKSARPAPVKSLQYILLNSDLMEEFNAFAPELKIVARIEKT
jgi:hypothetical protein